MTWPALIPNTHTKPLGNLGYHFTFNFNLTSLDFIKNRPLANFILRTWPALIPQLLRSSSLASTKSSTVVSCKGTIKKVLNITKALVKQNASYQNCSSSVRFDRSQCKTIIFLGTGKHASLLKRFFCNLRLLMSLSKQVCISKLALTCSPVWPGLFVEIQQHNIFRFLHL